MYYVDLMVMNALEKMQYFLPKWMCLTCCYPNFCIQKYAGIIFLVVVVNILAVIYCLLFPRNKAQPMAEKKNDNLYDVEALLGCTPSFAVASEDAVKAHHRSTVSSFGANSKSFGVERLSRN
jgi:hypothetical protein